MITKFSVKQKKFWTSYQQHGNLARAAKDAGSLGKNSKSLSATGRNILDSLGLTFQEKLNAFGLTDDFLMKGINEGCRAKKVEIATFQGKIKDEKAFPDYSTRGKYYDMLTRMKGLYIDKLELAGRDGGEIELVISKAVKKGSKTLTLD